MSNEPTQIRLRQTVSRRIVAVKIATARKLLTKGLSVTFELVFRDDEAKLAEQRLRLFGKISLALRDVSVAETMPEAGVQRRMTMTLRPVAA